MAENKTAEKPANLVNDLENLKVIKELLFDVKVRTMYAQWAFYVWGILIILGGVTHFLIEDFFTLKPMEYFVFIWVPVMTLTGLFELISFIQNMSKQSLNLLSRPIIKFFLSLILLCFMVIFTSIVFLQLKTYNYIPLFLTFAASCFFVIYAMATHINYLLPASILTAIPAVLFFFPIPTRILVLVCSLSIGIAWIAGGFICYFLEKEDKTDG